MPGLKDIVRKAHGVAQTKALPDTAPEKTHGDYVMPRHLAWMKRGNARAWSPAALEHARKVLAGEYEHERAGRLSPSALGGGCEREILFSYAGAPHAGFPLLNQEKMDSGSFDHLRWQMEGLSAGYMDLAEVWVNFPPMLCGGSADARLIDGSLFELKNTGGHLFEALRRGRAFLRQAEETTAATGKGSAATYAAGMLHKHEVQMEGYWELDRLSAELEGRDRLFTDWGSLVYQDTMSKDIHEYRVRSNPARLAEFHSIVQGLHEWVDLDDLPEMLDACRKASGDFGPGEMLSAKEQQIFDRCPYRDHCPSATRLTVE